jgi:acetyl esterase/lipase
MAPTQGGYYRVERDLPYAEGPRHRLDVYRPQSPPGAAPGPRPLIVYFYGGLWTMGNKEDPTSSALPEDLAARGAVVVVPDYRLYPDVAFPRFMEDGAAAIAWARRHAEELGSDPRLVFLAGHSTGAHMALLLGLDRRYQAAAGEPPLAGLIGVSGVYEPGLFVHRITRPIFGPTPDLEAILPAGHLGPGRPPLLLLAGTWDTVIDPGNTTRLAEAARSSGMMATARLYRGIGHGDILMAGPWLPSLAPAADDIAAFVRARTATILGQRT